MNASHGTAVLRAGGPTVWAWIVAIALAVVAAILISIAALGNDAAVEFAPGDTGAGQVVNPRQDYVLHPGGPRVGRPQASGQQPQVPCLGQC